MIHIKIENQIIRNSHVELHKLQVYTKVITRLVVSADCFIHTNTRFSQSLGGFCSYGASSGECDARSFMETQSYTRTHITDRKPLSKYLWKRVHGYGVDDTGDTCDDSEDKSSASFTKCNSDKDNQSRYLYLWFSTLFVTEGSLNSFIIFSRHTISVSE